MKRKIKYDKNFEKFALNVQKNIQGLRIDNELSQEDMMEYELSLRTIQRIENTSETANITLLTLFRLAKAYGVKPKDLIDI